MNEFDKTDQHLRGPKIENDLYGIGADEETPESANVRTL